MNLIETAFNYIEMGLSIIPIRPKDKKPLVKWEEFQSRFATQEEITKWFTDTPNANIGIVTGKLSNIFVVDLDKHDEKYNEEITIQYIPDTVVCPTVNTPKGGQHLYFHYPEINISIGARILPGIDFRGEGGFVVAPPSVNGNGKSYEWVVNFDRSILSALPASFQASILNNNKVHYIGECKNLTNDNLTNAYKPNIILQSGTRDQDLFTVANALIKSKVNIDFTKQVMNILAKNCNPPFPENEAEVKILSAIERANRRERNLAAEIREFITLQESYIDLTFAYRTLHLLTKEEKNNAMVIFNRLCKEGLIKKTGRGCYELVKEIEESFIDLESADTKTLPVKLPLGICDLVKIMPKNIIMIAGESNSGKTAFLLNVAARNMEKHEVIYFSSEMGGAELKERLQNYDRIPFSEWNHCTFIERASDFDVAIRPNAVNIIDFLEIHDEFYKIGGYIKKIFDKLENGIAIIAIQKNKGRDEGLGGARSIEKARLYLSMAPGTIKIIKAKNWVSGFMNPNGMRKDYKLVKGMNFKETSNWINEETGTAF
jgi:hypothetical protein